MDPKIYGEKATERWVSAVAPALGSGVAYKHSGRDADGLDCVGLLLWTYRQTGFDLPEPSETGKYPEHYWRKPSPIMLLPALLRYAQKIEPAKMTSGDILVFQATTRPAHVGLLDGVGFWHISEETGSIYESIVRSQWTMRLRCIMRLRPHILVTGGAPVASGTLGLSFIPPVRREIDNSGLGTGVARQLALRKR